jgi:small subunit ribosomal protein S20
VPELIVRAEKSFFQPVALVRPLCVPGALCNKHKDRFMANTSSAKKAARQMIRRTEVNKGRRTRVKSEVRSVEEAIKSGDRAKAEAALRSAEPILVRNAQKGIMHKKTASRKVSRLAQRVKAMSA